jgi:hypothetical protein
MIWADYAGTKEYRDELAHAVDVARQRMSARDFRTFSKGIESEIARLDSELAEYYDVLFPRTASNRWTPLFAKTIASVDAQSFSIRFNSPSKTLAPWTGSSPLLATDFNNNVFSASLAY